MVLKTLIFYAATLIVSLAALLGIGYAFKLRGRKLSKLHMTLGGVGFFAMLAAMFALMMAAFSEDAILYITAYMPEGLYKVLVGALFFAVISAVRYFALNLAYFNRGKCDNGESFLAGFGFCGCFLITFYSVYMFIFLAATAVGNTLISIDENGFLFKDGSVVPAFTQPSAVFLVAVVFIVYTVLCMIIGEFMTQHASLPYKKRSTFTVYSITAVCELIMCCTFLFSITEISTVAIIIISVLVAALAAGAVVLLYKYKEELPYEKQFD